MKLDSRLADWKSKMGMIECGLMRVPRDPRTVEERLRFFEFITKQYKAQKISTRCYGHWFNIFPTSC